MQRSTNSQIKRICWQSIFHLTGLIIRVESFVCEVGRERDQFNEWKWVFLHQNTCGCTRVIMGGLNTWTPIRLFVPKYYNSPLLSDDISEIRENYKFDCGEYKFISFCL